VRFYGLNPEIAGQLGDETVMDYSVVPYRVISLEYKFDSWLGDDLIAGFPVVIATHRLRQAIEEASLSGCSFAPMKVSRSEMFREFHGELELPVFWWMKLTGSQQADDFAESSRPEYSLVVSERALLCFKRFGFSHCRVEAL
jgi:hypothetical protein